jgi:hypothetical protein
MENAYTILLAIQEWKMFRAVFWVILPCKMIVDVSEVRTASIIRDESHGGSTHL